MSGGGARLGLHAAVSRDGCLGDADGGIGWLAPFDAQDDGLAGFLAGIGTILTGRVTWDQARGFAAWPHAGKRMVVLTRRALEPAPPDGVEPMRGDVAEFVAGCAARRGAVAHLHLADQMHACLTMGRFIPAAETVLRQAAAALRGHWGG